MKIFNCPVEIPAPEFNYKTWREDEDAHSKKLTQWLIAQGYTGKNTGKIFYEPYADGAAQYMFADGGRDSFLIHLPYGDAWDSPNVQYLPKKVIVSRLK